MDNSIRAQCYAKIRECMKVGIQQYYQEHPDRLMDERSKAAIEKSIEGLKCIIRVLDEYDLTDRVKPPESGTP